MSLIWTIFIGLVVGLIARALLPSDQKMGFILTTILGIAGLLAATLLALTLVPIICKVLGRK